MVVGKFLLEAGYTFVRLPFQHESFISVIRAKRVIRSHAFYGNFKGISAVFNFTKAGSRGRTLKVQLMIAVRSPIETVLHYHSSKSVLIRLSQHTFIELCSGGHERYLVRRSILPLSAGYPRETPLYRLYYKTRPDR